MKAPLLSVGGDNYMDFHLDYPAETQPIRCAAASMTRGSI